MVNTILTWTGIVIAVALIICTVMQETKTAPVANYGGNNNNKFKKKGKEAILNNLTKVFGILLFANAILLLRL